jgi:hypothetical protein
MDKNGDMCAAFERKGCGYKPGRLVEAIGANGLVQNVWAGFARREILDWWRSQGGELLDIPADRFAERSEETGRLVWDDVPEGLVLRGLLDRRKKEPLVKIVTRAATEEERRHFQHPRMPALERPLFAPCELPARAEDGFLF